jgi:hypothetical protein
VDSPHDIQVHYSQGCQHCNITACHVTVLQIQNKKNHNCNHQHYTFGTCNTQEKYALLHEDLDLSFKFGDYARDAQIFQTLWTTSKFYALERWHEGTSILRTYKYEALQYKIESPRLPGDQDLFISGLSHAQTSHRAQNRPLLLNITHFILQYYALQTLKHTWIKKNLCSCYDNLSVYNVCVSFPL